MNKKMILLLLPLLLAMSGQAQARTMCTNAVQAGKAEIPLDNDTWGRAGIEFIPVCTGEAIIVASATGSLSPGENATAQVLGDDFGAVGISLPEPGSGVYVINWQIVPSTQ